MTDTNWMLDSIVRITTGPYMGHKGIVVVVGDWGPDAPYGIYLPTENMQLWMSDDEFKIETTKRKEVGLYEFNKHSH